MTDIAHTDTTDIDVLPPARPAVSEAIGQLMLHAEAMAAAKNLASVLAESDLVGPDYKGKPGNAAVAILYGAELGLNPIQSLQQIFVVHGKPAIYARTAVALLMGHGISVETVSSSDTEVTVRALDPRTGRVEQATWNMDRAQKAKYTSNAKYQTNPQEMLYAKAAMEVCRKIAPDVLLGIPYAREEIDLEAVPRQVRSERVGRGVSSLRARAESTVVEAEADNQTAAADPRGLTDTARKKWQNRLFQLLDEADVSERGDQLIIIAGLAGRSISPLTLEHRTDITDGELQDVVTTLNKQSKDGTLTDTVRELLNTATVADENQEPS